MGRGRRWKYWNKLLLLSDHWVSKYLRQSEMLCLCKQSRGRVEKLSDPKDQPATRCITARGAMARVILSFKSLCSQMSFQVHLGA